MSKSKSSDPQLESNILDEEFERYKQIARNLMKKLRLPEDRRVSYKFIQRCENMKTENVQIKSNRNKFFRYLLKTMNRAVEEQKYNIFFDEEVKDMPQDKQTITKWSADKRTYVAAKVIPGYGTLVYMAASSKPELGWETNGFAKSVDISNIPNLPTSMDPIPL